MESDVRCGGYLDQHSKVGQAMTPLMRAHTDSTQPAERSQHFFARQRRSIEPVQGESQGVHQARTRDGGEELGGLTAAEPLGRNSSSYDNVTRHGHGVIGT